MLPLLERAPTAVSREPNRWGTGGLEETPVRHELVAEVRYDKVQGNRFRHGTKLIRFRDDKEPAQCTWREVRRPRPPTTRPSSRCSATSDAQENDHADEIREAADRAEPAVRRCRKKRARGPPRRRTRR